MALGASCGGEAATQQSGRWSADAVDNQDTYYDDLAGILEKRDQELRVRTVHGPNGMRTVLTFKDTTVDASSGSKPEHETRVEDSQEAHSIPQSLGYIPAIAFEKRCRN
ncbi:CYTH domain-containing protein [Streptomyces sp. NPDC050564]|uniref:CYTH domain-containing protein n=1 Tax=Streptomyces sp. NPDC050564 TaxID=3365631 RepID=UPI0037A51D37